MVHRRLKLHKNQLYGLSLADLQFSYDWWAQGSSTIYNLQEHKLQFSQMSNRIDPYTPKRSHPITWICELSHKSYSRWPVMHKLATTTFLGGLFFFIFVFSIQLKVGKQLNVRYKSWSMTADLWHRKLPLYQLSHNHNHCQSNNYFARKNQRTDQTHPSL